MTAGTAGHRARRAAVRAWDGLIGRLRGRGVRPDELLVRIGRRMGDAPAPERALAAAVAAVADGMRAPYVRVCLDGLTAEAGSPHGWATTTLPLLYRGRVAGSLAVEHRGPGEPWSRRETRLLLGVAAQLGISTAELRLTRDPAAARGSVIRAREEELRRLRRELHDGIGPVLSGARMVAHSVRSRATEPRLRRQLDDLGADLTSAAAELRRIIDDLHPSALDRGLAAALRAVVRRHHTDELAVGLRLPDDLTGLPAAVEVACYRVADEALTNVGRHARARNAVLTVDRQAQRLRVEVTDDGIGPGRPRAGGIGLDSMRGRCRELGGDLTVEDAGPGTRVRADLPLT